jgi:hypothetical protein
LPLEEFIEWVEVFKMEAEAQEKARREAEKGSKSKRRR